MLFWILYGFRPRPYVSDGAMRTNDDDDDDDDDDDGSERNTLQWDSLSFTFSPYVSLAAVFM